MTHSPIVIKVCKGFACSKNLSQYSFERAQRELKIEDPEGGLSADGQFCLEQCPCMGNCENGPNVKWQKNETEEIISHCSPLVIAEKIKNEI